MRQDLGDQDTYTQSVKILVIKICMLCVVMHVVLCRFSNLLCGLTHLDLHQTGTGAKLNDAIPIRDPGFTRHELFTNYG